MSCDIKLKTKHTKTYGMQNTDGCIHWEKTKTIHQTLHIEELEKNKLSPKLVEGNKYQSRNKWNRGRKGNKKINESKIFLKR